MRISLTDDDGKPVDAYSEEGLRALAHLWTKVACEHRMMYQPTWLGIPIIQYAEDVVMMQELIWRLRPDVIVETGIAHGGSAIFYASLLELIGHGKVVCVDIDIRAHNRKAIEAHPMKSRIELIEGSSVAPETVAKVKAAVGNAKKVLVTLDSNHSAAHVRQEIQLYAPLVSDDSYLVVMDGAQAIMHDIPRGKAEWQHDNPLVAIDEFLKANPAWESDPHFTRMLVTASPRGYLRRVRR